MKAAELFVQALVAEEVEYVFGVPGEENLELLDALRSSPVRFVLTRHEQAAGFMAATYGRLTGKPGVALSTLGPGATNLVTAAAFAQLGGMPFLMITGQKPIRNRKQGNFQIVSVVDMMQPLTKFTRQVVAAETIPALVREAFRLAQEERPGACHLELPQDVAGDEVDVPLLRKSQARRPVADDKSIAVAAQALRASKRPLLMIGAGANRKRTSKTLRSLVEKLGIPFFTTQMGKGVLDENHRSWVGNAALSEHDFVHRAIEASDCIINVGHDVVEKPPFVMRGTDRTVIHLNYQSAEVDTVYYPQIEVVGDIANALWRLTQALTPQEHWDFSFFDRVREAQRAQLEERTREDHFPLYAQRVVAEVRRAMGPEDIVCLDNGLYKLWFARNYRCSHPNTLLLDNALASMGAGLASAIAARLVYPERKVLAVCGDGGFMMNSQELETAVRLGIDLTVLILRDDAYGMIEWKQRNEQFARFGVELGNPDFVKYVESYGVRGHRPTAAAEFAPLLERALVTPGIDVIDVQVDYRDDDRILNHDIPSRSKALR